LSLLSAKNAGHTGLNPIMQAGFSISTWYAFAGHVNRVFGLQRIDNKTKGSGTLAKN
jgi:hypothetical protein